MADAASDSGSPASTSVVTSLQVKSTDLCRSYFSALGVLQNEARPAPLGEDAEARATRLQGMQALIDDLGAGVVTAHREIDGLIDELSRRVPCDEPDALCRLDQAQAEHAEVTEQLRERVERTGARAEPAAPSAPHTLPSHPPSPPITSVRATEQMATNVRGSLDSLLHSMDGT